MGHEVPARHSPLLGGRVDFVAFTSAASAARARPFVNPDSYLRMVQPSGGSRQCHPAPAMAASSACGGEDPWVGGLTTLIPSSAGGRPQASGTDRLNDSEGELKE